MNDCMTANHLASSSVTSEIILTLSLPHLKHCLVQTAIIIKTLWHRGLKRFKYL
jgi:hypothetical protein